MDNNGSVDFQVNKTNQKTCFNLSGIPNHRHNHQWGKQWGKVEADFSVGNQTLNKEPSKGKQGFSSFSIVLSKLFRIFDRDGDKSVSRCEMKGIVENLFHLIAESRREDKSPKEVKTFLFYYFFWSPRVGGKTRVPKRWKQNCKFVSKMNLLYILIFLYFKGLIRIDVLLEI